jgi:hypothetical protein
MDALLVYADYKRAGGLKVIERLEQMRAVIKINQEAKR